MSKREAIARYNLIINKVRKNPCTLKEIKDYLALESELQSYDFNISTRTFQRDLEDIRSLYDIDIQYDYSSRVYRIEMDQQPEVTERILEAFDTFNALNISDRLSRYISFEKRRPQGTENLYGLLHAIKKQLVISFSYQKFWEDEKSPRTIDPYLLKEFKHRWYLIGRDVEDGKVKSYGLERLSDLEISKKHFILSDNFDAAEHFRYCFGITSPNAEKPSDIILSFEPLQGEYIKTLPLHHTQEILEDNDQELRISLKLFITRDLVMELLSYGDAVKVIQPDILMKGINRIYESAMGRYL